MLSNDTPTTRRRSLPEGVVCEKVRLLTAAPVLTVPFAATSTVPVPWATHALTVCCVPTPTWLVMVIVLSSIAAVVPPDPETTSCRLCAEIAVKFVNLSPAIVNWSLPAKLVFTLILTVLLLSS